MRASASTILPAPPSAPPSPMQARRPQKIRVKIHRGEFGDWSVNSSHAVPPPKLVIEHLPAKVRAHAHAYWNTRISMDVLIHSTIDRIKPKLWTNAIAKATALSLSQQDETETELIAVDGGGYLSLGNALFRIDAIDYIEAKASKALPALRRTVLDAAKATAHALVVAGEIKKGELINESQILYQESEARRSVVMASFEAMQRQVNRIIPEWIQESGHFVTTVHPSYPHLYICIPLAINIDWWDFNGVMGPRRSVPALVGAPVHLSVCAPLNNRFSLRDVMVKPEWPPLPHITSYACLTTSDTRLFPEAIKSQANCNQVAAGIQFLSRRVNINSLLSKNKNWNGLFDRFMPPLVKQCFETADKTNDHYYSVFQRNEAALCPTIPNEGETFTVSPEAAQAMDALNQHNPDEL